MPSISNKRETYTHRPMQVSDDQLKANWDAIDWNAREEVPAVRGATEDAAAEEE